MHVFVNVCFALLMFFPIVLRLIVYLVSVWLTDNLICDSCMVHSTGKLLYLSKCNWCSHVGFSWKISYIQFMWLIHVAVNVCLVLIFFSQASFDDLVSLSGSYHFWFSVVEFGVWNIMGYGSIKPNNQPTNQHSCCILSTTGNRWLRSLRNRIQDNMTQPPIII